MALHKGKRGGGAGGGGFRGVGGPVAGCNNTGAVQSGGGPRGVQVNSGARVDEEGGVPI